MNPDDPITLAEACKLFPLSHLTPSTLRAEVCRGRLKTFPIGKRCYTTVANMRELFKQARHPSPIPVSLYRHFDENGVLLYVGIAVDPINRLSQHSKLSRWYDRIARIEIERHPTREAALAAELEAIRTERPLHNIAGKVAA